MIETLWNRHYVSGVTGDYHGDMAYAFRAMLADASCTEATRTQIMRSVKIHIDLEQFCAYRGRKWFSESFLGF